ncbi:MAG: hypothetical protein KAV82_07785, partial [Phycisphaerae bacterium]|nr:hypothetical protein [Phycisphaerae bacterium]
FEHLLPHAWWIDWRGRIIGENPGLTDEEYERGLDWSQAAARLAPENGCFLTTIGMLQYRLGDYAEALQTLGRAIERNGRAFPSDRAFVAMARWKLGHEEDARAALEEARTAMEGPSVPDEERNPEYLTEAESLISGETASEADAP